MRARVKLARVLAALAMLGGAAALAEEDRSGLAWMSGEDIQRTFSGQALTGLYPSQRAWSETIGTDGTTDYREGANHWQGRWWVRGREFCFSYPPPGVGGCFRITQISANCYELYEHTGEAGGDEMPPDIADLWNGRMWHADRPTTCEARPSV